MKTTWPAFHTCWTAHGVVNNQSQQKFTEHSVPRKVRETAGRESIGRPQLHNGRALQVKPRSIGHGCASTCLDNWHTSDGAVGVCLSGRIDRVVGAAHNGYVGTRELFIHLLRGPIKLIGRHASWARFQKREKGGDPATSCWALVASLR